MPRGGARAGSGRKPKEAGAVVLGMDGQRKGPTSRAAPVPALSAEEFAALEQAPTYLGADRQAVWARLAPRAVAERTLTPATAAGFEQLVEQWVYLATLSARIEVLGPSTREADGLLKTYIRLAQRLDSSLARFKLTAFGKPAAAEKPKQEAVSPWAQVAGKA